MDTLQIGTFTRLLPGTWNELTGRQLLRLLPEVYAPDRPDRRLRLLARLSGYPLALLAGLDVDVLAQLLPLTDWLASDQHLLTKQLLPTLIPKRGRVFHGPRDSFRNLLFGEFIFADTFFVLYCLHGRARHLDQLLATLYRPARSQASPQDDDWSGDVRVPFNEHHLETRAPLLAPLRAAERLAVLTWYRGCRTQLAQEFPDVFAAAEQDAVKPTKAPDWGRVLRKLSGGAFGPVQQTAGQPVRLVLAELQDALQEVNRLKATRNHA